MPYRAGNRLSGESASKLGHLDVIKSELVNELVSKFESSDLGILETDCELEHLHSNVLEWVVADYLVLYDKQLGDVRLSHIYDISVWNRHNITT